MEQAQKPKIFDDYPLLTVIITNLVSLLIYFAGLYLLYLIMPVLAALFLVYMLYLEFSLYRGGCAYCCYYGKMCAFGRGKIAALFAKKGEPRKFCERKMEFKEFLPHLAVAFVPLIAGAYLLLQNFSWPVLILALLPLIITFAGNPIIYGKLACPHCKQGQICCPACEFFMKQGGKK